MDQRQVVGLPLRAQLLEDREVRRVAAGEAAPQRRPAGLEQVVERAAAPALRVLATLARPPVLDDRALVRHRVAAPAEDAALVDRVQRVDEDEGARERQPGGDGPLAEAAQEIRLGRPGQPRGRDPGPDLRRGRVVHAVTLRTAVSAGGGPRLAGALLENFLPTGSAEKALGQPA